MIEGKIPELCGRPKRLLSFLPESPQAPRLLAGPRTLQLLLGFLVSQVQGLLLVQWEQKWCPLGAAWPFEFFFWGGRAPDVQQHISAFLLFPILRLAGSLSRLLLQLQIKKRSQGGILGSQRRWESSRSFSPQGVRNLYLACCFLSLLWPVPWHLGIHPALSSLKNTLRVSSLSLPGANGRILHCGR